MTSGRRATQPRAADALALAALLGAAALLLAISGRPLATDDTWWHLKLGEVYAEQGPFVPEDPLLHTAPGQATVPHEWLFQILLHGVERAAGFVGLRVLHASLVAGILAAIFVTFRRATRSWALAASATVVWIVLSWYRLIQLRPDLLSLLALLLLTGALLARREPPSLWRGAATLALLVVWANVHSLFAIGLALLLAALVGSLLEYHGLGAPGDPRARARSRALLALLLIGSLATALNPQGFALHATFFTESASGDIWRLEDDFLRWLPWRSADANAALPWLSWLAANLLLLAWLIAVVAAARRLLRERSAAALAHADLVGLALSAAAWVAMLVAVRFHWLAFLPLLSVLRATPATRRTAWAAAATACALLLGLPRAVDLNALRQELAEEPGGYWKSPYLEARYCANAARFLETSGVEGKLFHPFNLGGYLGYRLAPTLRTFVDGRLDHVPAGVLDDYLEIRQAIRMSDEARFAKRLDAYGIDFFVGTHFRENRYGEGTWTDQLRRLPGWIPVFASQECSVYLRAAPRNNENLARVAAAYEALGIPFSLEHGPDLGAALEHHRAWADTNRITPPGFDALLREQAEGSIEQQLAAVDALARGLWRVGAFREQLPLDRVLIEHNPDAPEPRRRLADGLLQLGRAEAALPIAEGLVRQHPRYSDVQALRRVTALRSGR
uniref:Tetratricopeptide repeat protein n=1 Tax=uncultured bacterium W4-39b TaxID=1130994 RepID=H9BWQ2_9BACT|nr:hypothetical protein [uncultured bacterium W4-39b]